MSATYPSARASLIAALGEPTGSQFERAWWYFAGAAKVTVADDGFAVWVATSAPDPLHPGSRTLVAWTLAGEADEDAPLTSLDDAVAAVVGWLKGRGIEAPLGAERPER